MLSDVTYDRGSLKMHCVILGPIEKPASSISHDLTDRKKT